MPPDADLIFEQWIEDSHAPQGIDVREMIAIPVVGKIRGAMTGPCAERHQKVVDELRRKVGSMSLKIDEPAVSTKRSSL